MPTVSMQEGPGSMYWRLGWVTSRRSLHSAVTSSHTLVPHNVTVIPASSYEVSITTPYSVSLRNFISREDRKSTRLNSSHVKISYAVFCLKKKNNQHTQNHA